MDWAGWVAVVLAIIALFVDQLRVRSANRRVVAAEERAAKREAKAAARGGGGGPRDDAWLIHHELSPLVESGGLMRAGVLVRPVGINLWIHEVRLSWRPAGASAWVADDDECHPLEGALPVQFFTEGAGLDLDWPGPNPSERTPLDYRVRVLSSISEHGQTHWRPSDEGSVNW